MTTPSESFKTISMFDNVITNMLVTEENFEKWCNLVNKNTKITQENKAKIVDKINNAFKQHKNPKKCTIQDSVMATPSVKLTSTQAPKRTPTQSTTQSTTQAPKRTPTQSTTQAPTRTPTQSTTQAPKTLQSSTKSPMLLPKQSSSSTRATTIKPTQSQNEARLSSKLSLEEKRFDNILNSRIEKYYEITNTLKGANDDFDLIFDETNENLNLVVKPNNKQIVFNKTPITKGGTFGIVYKGYVISDNNRQIAAKIQLNSHSAKREIAILQYLTQINVRDNIDRNIHFPIFYKNIMISRENKTTDAYPHFFRDTSNTTKYANISIIEIANGDFKKFVKSNPSADIFLNAVAQIFMAIASLHTKKIMHNDTHNGNFLFFKVKPGGFIRYNIDGLDYYIENLGYIWIIWDFGICTPIYRDIDYMRDYEMFSLYIRHDTGDVNKHFPAMDINDKSKTVFRKQGNISTDINIPDDVKSVANLIEDVCGRDGRVANLYNIRTKYGQESLFIHEICRILGDVIKASAEGTIISEINLSFGQPTDAKNIKLFKLLDGR